MERKIIDNCHTCGKWFRNMEACPLYLWTGYEDNRLDVMFYYSLDMTMVIASLIPYLLAIIIIILALGYRKSHLVCKAILIISQYVICHILKTIIRQRRPSCIFISSSILFQRAFIWHAEPTCVLHSRADSLVLAKEARY